MDEKVRERISQGLWSIPFQLLGYLLIQLIWTGGYLAIFEMFGYNFTTDSMIMYLVGIILIGIGVAGLLWIFKPKKTINNKSSTQDKMIHDPLFEELRLFIKDLLKLYPSQMELFGTNMINPANINKTNGQFWHAYNAILAKERAKNDAMAVDAKCIIIGHLMAYRQSDRMRMIEKNYSNINPTTLKPIICMIDGRLFYIGNLMQECNRQVSTGNLHLGHLAPRIEKANRQYEDACNKYMGIRDRLKEKYADIEDMEYTLPTFND